MGKPLNYFMGCAKLIRMVGCRGSLWLQNKEVLRREKMRGGEGREEREKRGRQGRGGPRERDLG